MKKMFISVLILLLILPSVLAINLEIKKTSSNEVMIFGIKEPVIFDLEITNNGADDNIKFYNLVGFNMFPIGTTPIAAGETKNIHLKVSPIGEFEYKGAYTFEYFIRGDDSSEIKKELTFKIVDLKNSLEIGSGDFDPESNSVEIYINNKVNFNFPKISAKFRSAFFDFQEDFSLAPYEKKKFNLKLDKEDFKKLMAGFYTLNSEVSVEEQKAKLEGVIKFSEKNIITTTKKNYGLIINTEIIEKANEGNILSKSETILKKNIISRLFTSFNPEPDIVERQGLIVYYTWIKDINPGEKFEINVKTNWLLPFLIILFVIIIVISAKIYTKTNLVLKKRVSFVKAKGGEFALKISIIVNARKYIERVRITDRLPPLVKIYERFGVEKPLRIDENKKKIEWDFEKLEAGETRILSYLIYSKVGVIGKFALPKTTAIYEKNGEIHESESNTSFFVAEQRKEDLEEG